MVLPFTVTFAGFTSSSSSELSFLAFAFLVLVFDFLPPSSSDDSSSLSCFCAFFFPPLPPLPPLGGGTDESSECSDASSSSNSEKLSVKSSAALACASNTFVLFSASFVKFFNSFSACFIEANISPNGNYKEISLFMEKHKLILILNY